MRLISLVQEKEKLPIGWQKRKSPVSGVLVYVCGGVHPSADTQSVPLDAGFPAWCGALDFASLENHISASKLTQNFLHDSKDSA